MTDEAFKEAKELERKIERITYMIDLLQHTTNKEKTDCALAVYGENIFYLEVDEVYALLKGLIEAKHELKTEFEKL